MLPALPAEKKTGGSGVVFQKKSGQVPAGFPGGRRVSLIRADDGQEKAAGGQLDPVFGLQGRDRFFRGQGQLQKLGKKQGSRLGALCEYFRPDSGEGFKEFGVFQGLEQIGEGSLFNGRFGIAEIRIAGKDDHLRGRILLLEL